MNRELRIEALHAEGIAKIVGIGIQFATARECVELIVQCRRMARSRPVVLHDQVNLSAKRILKPGSGPGDLVGDRRAAPLYAP